MLSLKSKKSKALVLVLLLAVAIVVVVSVWTRLPLGGDEDGVYSSTSSRPSPTNAVSTDSADGVQEALHAVIDQAYLAFAAGNRDHQQAERLMVELRRKMAESPSGASIPAIIAFLESKRDADTGASFQVGPDGYLVAAPTFRIILLDLLERLDPGAAAEYASKIFEESRIAGEWTLALRSQGRLLDVEVARQSSVYRSHVTRHLSNHEWLQSPPPGYLHGFDAAVYLGGREQSGQIARIHREEDHPATRFAARLALDRLAMRNFLPTAEAVTEVLNERDELDRDRALVISRANPMSERDMAVVREYLLDARIGREEKDAFLASFPNANLEISHNILTETRHFAMSVIREWDNEAARIMENWATRQEFEEISDALTVRASAIRGLSGTGTTK